MVKKEQTHIRVDRSIKRKLESMMMKRGDKSMTQFLKRLIRFGETKAPENEMNIIGMNFEEVLRVYFPDGLADIVTDVRQIATLARGLDPVEYNRALDDLADQAKRTLADILNTSIIERGILSESQDGVKGEKPPL